MDIDMLTVLANRVGPRDRVDGVDRIGNNGIKGVLVKEELSSAE